jgi:hypothetical protein
MKADILKSDRTSCHRFEANQFRLFSSFSVFKPVVPRPSPAGNS